MAPTTMVPHSTTALTANNLLGLEMVLMDGEVVRLGGRHLDSEGYDLLGLATGSEGLLGVVTEVIVRILRRSLSRAALVGRQFIVLPLAVLHEVFLKWEVRIDL